MEKIINIISGFTLIIMLGVCAVIFARMIFADICYMWREYRAEIQAKRWENIKYIAGATADGYEKQNS